MFRVGILSFWHVHAQDYAAEAKEHPEAEISAVWDEDDERGRAEAARRGASFYASLDSLLASGEVDGVVVTTPTVAHREIIPKAARAGKHVFSEKVIAPTLGEAREIVSAVEAAGVAFVVSLPRLYAGFTRAIKEAIEGGLIGEVTYLRARVSHDGALPEGANLRRWLPERFFDPAESAGGVTVDFGYPSGALGVAESSFLGASAPFLIEVHGTEGSLLYDPKEGLRTRVVSEEGFDAGWRHDPVPADEPSPFSRWVDLAASGRTAPENVRAALALSALAEAAQSSATCGRPALPGRLP